MDFREEMSQAVRLVHEDGQGYPSPPADHQPFVAYLDSFDFLEAGGTFGDM